MKLDTMFDLPCECGLCAEEGLCFECPGCLRDSVPYCQGGSDDYWQYCTPCWYELDSNLTTVVILLDNSALYSNKE